MDSGARAARSLAQRGLARAAGWGLLTGIAGQGAGTRPVGALAAGAGLRPPRRSPEQEQRLAELAADRLGPAAGDYLELVSRFDAAHPRAEPHYYLTLLGTHPDHRGKGIGMRLLAHDLELVDAEHQPAYLESSNPANNHRYASVGFEPHGEFRYPRGGPVVTTMWRPAR